MHCGCVALIIVHDETLSFSAHENSVAIVFHMFATDGIGTVARGSYGSFIHEIGQFPAGKSGSPTGNPFKIHVSFQLALPRMNSNDSPPPTNISAVNDDLSIKS